MPFTLTVVSGTETFTIDGDEARFGRTADNDVVVNDPAASRLHCRVFRHGAGYAVEDLGSANGTKLNGAALSGLAELNDGDVIAIGAVGFRFARQGAAESTLDATQSDVAGAQTVLKKLDTAEQAVVRGDTTTQERAAVGDSTEKLVALSSAELKPDADATLLKMHAETRSVDDSTAPPNRLAVKPVGNETLQVHVPPPVSLQRAAEQPVVLSAADKARLKREAKQSVAGLLTYRWALLSPMGKRLAGASVLLVTVLLVGFAVVAWWPKRGPAQAPEPTELVAGAETVEASFGVGAGVTYERSDFKTFAFEAPSPTKVVGVVHYQAREIGKGEVSVSVNGVELGFVEPDTADPLRELETVLPAQHLKARETNTLVFDNVNNPPRDDAWRVSNLWLELVALPQMTPEETIAAVREEIARAGKLADQRDIGPDNLFRAWKQYREAWLKLESLPDRPAELYVISRNEQRTLGADLDRKCAGMQLDIQKALNAKKPDVKRARQVVDDMLRYFPSREHRCHWAARSLIEELGGSMPVSK